jgi:glycosyltransferase involved in cell wall biosynthesis
MTTLSIIIANYNYADYLPASIESAIAQGDHEVIVVDDGSSDDSRRVIANYSDRVKAIFKENGGHSSAVNIGFENSTGDYVVFLDADDVMLPDCAEAILGVANPSVSKVQWGLRIVDSSGVPTGHVYPTFSAKHTPLWCRTQLARCSWYDAPPTSGNAWSRVFLSIIMPLPEAVGSPGWALDDYLHLVAPSFGDVISLTNVLGEYRIHQNQMSALQSALVDRIRWVCSDEEVRYALVNDILSESLADHSVMEPMKWSHHALNRLLLRKAGYRHDNLMKLVVGYLRAFARADTSLRSKLVNSGYGVVLALSPPRTAEWLIRKRLRAAAPVFAGV